MQKVALLASNPRHVLTGWVLTPYLGIQPVGAESNWKGNRMAAARVALAVGGGYLLGRTKKLRLAITLGSYVAGRKLAGQGAGGMLGQSLQVLRSSPELDRLREQLKGAGRNAAMSAATQSLGRVTERIENGPSKRKAIGRGGDDDESQSDEYDDDYDDADDAADDE